MKIYSLYNPECGEHETNISITGTIAVSNYAIRYSGCPQCFDAIAAAVTKGKKMPERYKKLVKEIV